MKRIGFAGLGTMGVYMAHNLMRAGFELAVYNRNPDRMGLLADEGATPCESPKELGSKCELAVVCVSDAPDVEEVIMGPNGISKGMKSPGIIVDCSTSSPKLAREMADKLRGEGIGILDAPVSGGPEGARHGTLAIMVGGEEDVYHRALPALEAMGKSITLVGPPGAGQLAKAVNQIIVAMNLEAVAEGIALAKKSGINPERVLKAISGGAAKSWILEMRGPLMLQEKFSPPNFALELHTKDLRLAMDAAADCGAKLDLAQRMHEIFQSLLKEGKGHLDHSGVYEHMKRENGL